MLIRRAEAIDAAADAVAVFGILDCCFSEAESGYWSLQSVSDLLRLETTRAYIALDGNDDLPVGCILARGAAGEAEILNLAVLPSARRRGIAAAMLAQLIDEGRVDGIEDWSLEVRAGNAAAQALYIAAGFARAGVRQAYYRSADGKKSDAVIMSITL